MISTSFYYFSSSESSTEQIVICKRLPTFPIKNGRKFALFIQTLENRKIFVETVPLYSLIKKPSARTLLLSSEQSIVEDYVQIQFLIHENEPLPYSNQIATGRFYSVSLYYVECGCHGPMLQPLDHFVVCLSSTCLSSILVWSNAWTPRNCETHTLYRSSVLTQGESEYGSVDSMHDEDDSTEDTAFNSWRISRQYWISLIKLCIQTSQPLYFPRKRQAASPGICQYAFQTNTLEKLRVTELDMGTDVPELHQESEVWSSLSAAATRCAVEDDGITDEIFCLDGESPFEANEYDTTLCAAVDGGILSEEDYNDIFC